MSDNSPGPSSTVQPVSEAKKKDIDVLFANIKRTHKDALN